MLAFAARAALRRVVTAPLRLAAPASALRGFSARPVGLLLPPPLQLPSLCASVRHASAARLARALAPGATPDAGLKSYKPTTNGQRHRIVIDKRGLWPGGPMKSLTKRLNSHAGRNNTGGITIRGRKAPKHRRMYRTIDFKRLRTDPAVVVRRRRSKRSHHAVPSRPQP